MTAFIITASIVFLVLGIIWTKSTWINTFVKVILLGMGGWGGFLSLQLLGYVVQA